MDQALIIFTNVKEKDFFISSRYDQLNTPDYMKLPGYKPSTCILPMGTTQTERFPDGQLNTERDVLDAFHLGKKQIPNPDIRYQAGGSADEMKQIWLASMMKKIVILAHDSEIDIDVFFEVIDDSLRAGEVFCEGLMKDGFKIWFQRNGKEIFCSLNRNENNVFYIIRTAKNHVFSCNILNSYQDEPLEIINYMIEKLSMDYLGVDERDFILSLPSMDDDEKSWEKCGTCAVDGEKHVEYVDCGSCKHLCLNKLQEQIFLNEDHGDEIDFDQLHDKKEHYDGWYNELMEDYRE